ncbi:MAG: GNAT family N-acetyltransferase, partial [Clostridium sp.]
MFKEIKREDLNELVDIYIEAFNGEPWNDNWTYETASKRLENMLDDSGFYGLKLIKDNEIVA